MKITIKSETTTRFGDLRPGGVFRIPIEDAAREESAVLFIKLYDTVLTKSGRELKAVSLDDGSPVSFSAHEHIIALPQAEVIV